MSPWASSRSFASAEGGSINLWLSFLPLRRLEEESHMKSLSLVILLSGSALVAGCASMNGTTGMNSPAVAAPAATAMPSTQARSDVPSNQIRVQDEAGSVVVQKVEFKPGVSSATVERLAKQAGCAGSSGAGLVTEKGPVEVYRMQCDNGVNFLARCELRQCRPLR